MKYPMYYLQSIYELYSTYKNKYFNDRPVYEIDAENNSLNPYFNIGLFFCSVYVILYFILGLYISSVLNIVFFAIYLVSKIVYSYKKENKYILAVLVFIHLFIMSLSLYGYSPAILIWFICVPWSVLILFGRKSALKSFIIVGVTLLIIDRINPYVVPIIEKVENPNMLFIHYLDIIIIVGNMLLTLIALIKFSDLKDDYAFELLDKNKELEHSKEELQEHQKIKDLFFANLSHEIRTPLNAISIISELINRQNISQEEFLELIQTIEQSSNHLNALVSDMLDFSKIKEQKLHLKKDSFNLKETLQKTFKMLQVKFHQKDLKTELVITDAFPSYVLADEQRIVQILLNIVGNAFKFTQEGYVKVLCHVTESEVEGFINAQIQVEDSGIGMDKETQKHIYDPYFQAIKGNVENTGTGLGLNIVKTLVEMYNGTILCNSTLHGGTTFTINLQLEVDSQRNKTVCKLKTQQQLEEKINNIDTEFKVLMVDDNNLNLMLLDRLLHKLFGDKIIKDKAENGLICVDKLQQKDYDLIFMDLQMPEMDGIEATYYIRNQLPSSISDITIIALTANADEANIEKCYAAGMNDILSKPLRLDDLNDKLIQYL